jgi:hypothetical protein
MPGGKMEQVAVAGLARENNGFGERLCSHGQVTRILGLQTKIERDDSLEVARCAEQYDLFGRQGIELVADGEDMGALFGARA